MPVARQTAPVRPAHRRGRPPPLLQGQVADEAREGHPGRRCRRLPDPALRPEEADPPLRSRHHRGHARRAEGRRAGPVHRDERPPRRRPPRLLPGEGRLEDDPAERLRRRRPESEGHEDRPEAAEAPEAAGRADQRPPRPGRARHQQGDRALHSVDGESSVTAPASGTALVLGANGFLGSHVTRQLVAAGRDVRILVRRTSNTRALDDLAVERCIGDVMDPAVATRRRWTDARRCSTARRHPRLAARPGPALPRERRGLAELDRRGARDAPCSGSSSRARSARSGVRAAGPATERDEIDPDEIVPAYVRSRLDAERLLLAACQRARASRHRALRRQHLRRPATTGRRRTAQLVQRAAKGQMLFSWDGGGPSVDVERRRAGADPGGDQGPRRRALHHRRALGLVPRAARAGGARGRCAAAALARSDRRHGGGHPGHRVGRASRRRRDPRDHGVARMLAPHGRDGQHQGPHRARLEPAARSRMRSATPSRSTCETGVRRAGVARPPVAP